MGLCSDARQTERHHSPRVNALAKAGIELGEWKHQRQMAVSLPQGVLNELPAEEREHREDHDEHQHEHDAESDYALLSSFTSDVPRHARQCRRARGNGPAWGEWEHLPKAEGEGALAK